MLTTRSKLVIFLVLAEIMRLAIFYAGAIPIGLLMLMI